MIKLAQSTINEDERKRILYQSLMVSINCISFRKGSKSKI